MTKKKITIPVKMIYVISQIIDTFLHKTIKRDDGTEVTIDRDLPFRLRYRLERNLDPLRKYMVQVESTKTVCLAKFGTYDEETQSVKLEGDEAKKAYMTKFKELMNLDIDLEIIPIEEEDLDLIEGLKVEEISNDMIRVLINYMIGDQPLLTDLAEKLDINIKETENVK